MPARPGRKDMQPDACAPTARTCSPDACALRTQTEPPETQSCPSWRNQWSGSAGQPDLKPCPGWLIEELAQRYPGITIWVVEEGTGPIWQPVLGKGCIWSSAGISTGCRAAGTGWV